MTRQALTPVAADGAPDVAREQGLAVPNLVVGLASGAHPGDLNIFNAMGSINAVLDVDGWFQ